MKEIVLQEKSTFLRGEVISATIQEEKLVFQNGLAIAEARVKTKGTIGEYHTYICMGIINEDFEEVFSIEKATDLEKYLMFMPFNQRIQRNDNNFIVTVKKSMQGFVYNEDIFLYLENSARKVVAPNFSRTITTQTQGIQIVDRRLYRVAEKTFLTHQLQKLEEIRQNEFYVEDLIFSQSGNCKNENTLYDILRYKMDKDSKVISPIYSRNSYPNTLYKEILPLSCDEVYARRQKELNIFSDSFDDATRILKR